MYAIRSYYVTVAIILYHYLPETKPTISHTETKRDEPLFKTVVGYNVVILDLAFMSFILAGMIALIVYQQQYSSMAVYLRDVHGISSKSYA